MSKPRVSRTIRPRKKAAERARQYAFGIFTNWTPQYDRHRELIKTAWLVGYRAAKNEAYREQK